MLYRRLLLYIINLCTLKVAIFCHFSDYTVTKVIGFPVPANLFYSDNYNLMQV
jgi:hypothetical protein